MRVLIGCEFSGITRDAFAKLGHDAWSCDLVESERPGNHYQCDVRDVLHLDWDLAIFHPDCTYLTNAGARWFTDPSSPHHRGRRRKQRGAIEFFKDLLYCGIPRICIENPQPLGVVMNQVGRYTQKVQPWMFGDNRSKGLCLWLTNLPPLIPTHEKPDQIKQEVWLEPPGPNRKRNRSRSFEAVAAAMAEQWGV